MEDYRFPFGEQLHRLAQEDRRPKKVFVLGVYASAVHARWMKDSTVICPALAVASEPRIFWDGNEDEAREIIGRIKIPAELGTLSPAGKNLNGPSAKVLDEQILAPLGFSRKDAWLCDLMPESRINKDQKKAIERCYNENIGKYHLNPVTVPERKSSFCDAPCVMRPLPYGAHRRLPMRLARPIHRRAHRPNRRASAPRWCASP